MTSTHLITTGSTIHLLSLNYNLQIGINNWKWNYPNAEKVRISGRNGKYKLNVPQFGTIFNCSCLGAMIETTAAISMLENRKAFW